MRNGKWDVSGSSVSFILVLGTFESLETGNDRGRFRLS